MEGEGMVKMMVGRLEEPLQPFSFEHLTCEHAWRTRDKTEKPTSTSTPTPTFTLVECVPLSQRAPVSDETFLLPRTI